MSIGFINGAKYAVSTTIGAAVPISAISNASPAVASATNPPPANSIGIITSNWSELEGVPFKSGTVVAGASFELPGYDTTDVARYPAGEGGGAFRVASDFVSITGVVNIESDGGDQNFYEYQEIDDPSSRIRRIPTNKSAQGWTLTMNHDPDKAWYQTLIDLDRKKEKVVLRETLPTGEVVLYYGYLSFNKVPTKVPNETRKVSAVFSLDSDPVVYEAP